MPEKRNIFSWVNGLPYHISVGAAVVNDQGKVLVHHFSPEVFKGQEVYLLMRETIEPGESLEETVKRGLAEEFGIEATIVDYLGSIACNFTHPLKPVEVEKTTLYFLCHEPRELVTGRHKEDLEGQSQLEWHNPIELTQFSRQQALATNRADINEAKIFERVAAIVNEKS